MAEVVEKNLEESLQEILYIKKAKLFKKSEINEIVRRRRQHEYALQKRNKRVLDYDAYITTELTLLKLLRFRRKVSRDVASLLTMLTQQTADEQRYVDRIERSIITRLVRLHRQLCYRFQSRIDVWMRFLRFYRILGRHMSMVRLWNRILQVHGRTDPRLWAAAAAYHLHEHVEASAKASLRQLTEEAEELTDKRKEVSKELNILKRDADSNQKKSMHKILQDLSK